MFKFNENPTVAGVRYNLDDAALNNSSSGGFFIGLSKYILKNGGFVYGAAFDKNNVVRHVRVSDISELPQLQGSKYVQSKLGCSFLDVKNDIAEGRLVLFTGTPCQVAGLSSFLGKNYSNLISMDFTCHGVPSPSFFDVYLKWLQNKYGFIIGTGDFVFRTKKHGWYYRRHMSYTLRVGTHFLYVGSDPYYSNFLKGTDYRESCYLCPFKMQNHFSDFTVGDFNGVDIAYPNFYDKRGVSYAVLNTPAAHKIFESLKDSFEYIDVDYSLLIKYNRTYTQPVKRPKSRDTFYTGLYDDGFTERKNKSIPFQSRVKPYIPYFIENICKRIRRIVK